MADDNREQRMEALRARVQAKKAKSNMPEIEEELVVSAEEFEAVVEATELQQEEEWFAMQDRDADRWRNLAGTLILIGSILGLLSGALILQGNPSELLSTSLFDADDAVDISGEILQSMEGNGSEDGGHGIENVTVELMDASTRALLQATVTNEYGYYFMENVAPKQHIIMYSKDGYDTVERTFTPDSAGLAPVTMNEGNETRYESDDGAQSGWTLDAAVTLTSSIGLFTILTAFVGIQSAVEARRGKHYRRTQYFAGISLFSRGMIVFGPALILFGMILLSLVSDDFEDQRGD